MRKKYSEEMECDHNSCTIKVCIPPYISAGKKKHILSKHGGPINGIKYGVLVTCFRTLLIVYQQIFCVKKQGIFVL